MCSGEIGGVVFERELGVRSSSISVMTGMVCDKEGLCGVSH